jgi:hypothetical protein
MIKVHKGKAIVFTRLRFNLYFLTLMLVLKADYGLLLAVQQRLLVGVHLRGVL